MSRSEADDEDSQALLERIRILEEQNARLRQGQGGGGATWRMSRGTTINSGRGGQTFGPPSSSNTALDSRREARSTERVSRIPITEDHSRIWQLWRTKKNAAVTIRAQTSIPKKFRKALDINQIRNAVGGKGSTSALKGTGAFLISFSDTTAALFNY
mmetsp:Transcript_3172/g.4406  ORF Transcript_3172/g.4406 Transcript_3172/m.4406 type:complete len:157 (+) Transcript_3172:770-1240(+)